MESEITPEELRDRLGTDAPPLVVDVREDWEVETAPFPGARHVPMTDIPVAVDQLPKDRDIVVLCHHGGRSFSVAMLLQREGLRAANLAGGIDAWSRSVDPSIPSY